jgi:hypothetical protein
MSRFKFVTRAALLSALAACSGDMTSPTAPNDVAAPAAISDAAHSGAVPGFYFLPPMVPAASYSGVFDAGLQPRVEICQLVGMACGPVIATFPFGTGSSSVRVDAAGQHYIANWNASKSLDPAKFYRVQVFVGTFRLGYADVDVVRTGSEKNGVDQTQFVPLVAGQSLAVKFRIEKGIAAQVVVSPDSASVAVAGTQQFTATVNDLHGNPIPGAPVSWASSAAAVATVDASGLTTGVATGQAAITATSGGASDSGLLVVFNPNTPPVVNADTFQAIGNVTVPVPAPGLLANDTDGEGNTLQAVAGAYPTTGGGTVTVNADGSFVYLSAAGFTGRDSFSYTVTDGQATSSASASVVSTHRVWYVDNAAPGPGDGRDVSPFGTLAGAESASAGSETIFVRTGAASYDGGITLKTGQSLTGQGVAANVTVTLNGMTMVLLAAGSAPTVTRTTAGPTVQLAPNTVVQGMAITSSAGSGIAGTGFASLTVGALSVSATGGAALDLSSGSVFGSFTALSSSGSAGSGIRLLGIGGSFSAAGGSIVTPAGAGVEVTGGDAAFSYGGDIAVAGPLAVSVTGRTGGALAFGGTIASTGQGISVQNNSGGSVSFTGSGKSLATGANPGVLLANNTGAQITFAGGGLAIGTTTGVGFEASGGGTVSVTGGGNTVMSAGGTAVRIENATIGAAGITFRSVTASGGTNGIVLTNTGFLNGMQVTGSGTAGSGGTISGVTGADGSTSGIGVYLASTANVVLKDMQLNDFSNFAIRGANVVGFKLLSSVVSGSNGTSAALGEGAVSFDGLTGSASIESSTVSGGASDNVRVVNPAGTLDRLTIQGTTIGLNHAATGGDGVSIVAGNSAVVKVTVQNSTFLGARTDMFQLSLLNASAGDLVLSGNTMHNAHPAVLSGAGGVLVSTTGAGTTATLTYQITGNSLRGAKGTALAVIKGSGTGSFSGTVSNNFIGATGVAGSGASAGSGIQVETLGGGSHTTAVTNNQVRQYGNYGILAQAGDNTAGGSGSLNATVTGNVVAERFGAFAGNGFHLNAGTVTGDAHQVCLALSGNSLTGSGAVADVRLRQRMLTTVRLPGYAGANNDNLAAQAFVQATNGLTPTVQASNTVSGGGGGYVGGAACAQH